MQINIVLKTIGLLLMVFSLTLIPPILIDLIYNEDELFSFLLSFLLTFLGGFILWFLTRNTTKNFRIREGI